MIHITTPIPTDDSYDVRVNAIVTRDDGTTETLNPTALGNYPILGNVVITYTYSPKAEVKLRKRDASSHETILTDAAFVMTPVEYNTSTGRWENAGDGKNVTISSATESFYLQEGTYKITESAPPTGYAAISSELYLTVSKEGEFSLFDSAGNEVDAQIAELDSDSKRILTMYDNPIRTVTLSKIVDAANTEGSFSFKVTVFDSDGSTRLRNTVIATQNGTDVSTDSIGEATVILSHNEVIELEIPNGCLLTVEESVSAKYKASYVWNSEPSVDSLVFGSEPVSITADSTLAYTNTPSSQKLRIHKIGDDAASGLAGAKFDLTAPPGTDGFDNLTGITSLDGTSVPADLGYLPGNDSADTTLFLLPVGTYTLSETDAPDYYDGLSGDVTLTVTSEGITMSKGDDSDDVELSEPDQDVYTLTVSNIRKLGTVTVIKNVVGTDADKEKTYSFTQTGLTGEATFNLRGSDNQTTEGILENQTVFENVPFGTVFSITEANTYTDFDTTIMISNEDPAVTTTRLATGNVTVDSEVVTITYTNTRNNQPIKVFKYETGTTPEHPLANAVFSLTGPEGSGISYTGLTTNADGYLVNGEGILFKLPVNNGAYMLTETQATAGYQIIGEGKTTFTVAAASVTGAIAETQKVGEAEVLTGVYVIKVQNSAGAELPHTGGPGTTLIYFLGIMLTGFAGAGLVMRRRRNDK
ncbi:MAG: LPXTG cell wall anchor domain-containing protein [Lachnospiraceae bacterium]|nr:LPXTG cell wall anchor domain-containing protein [Lachnospiraceae bacterium]